MTNSELENKINKVDECLYSLENKLYNNKILVYTQSNAVSSWYSVNAEKASYKSIDDRLNDIVIRLDAIEKFLNIEVKVVAAPIEQTKTCNCK